MTTDDFEYALIAVDRGGNCFQIAIEETKLRKMINTNFKKVVIPQTPLPGLQVIKEEVENEAAVPARTTKKNRVEASV
jgi:hypothetical protein